MANLQTPELKSIEQVSDGWLKKYLLTYKLANGAEVHYEAVSRKGYDDYVAQLHRGATRPQTPDAVCIVPRTQDNRLVLIREFRYALNDWCVMFPAGLVEPGEAIEVAVERELAEETGYPLVRDAEGQAHVRVLSQPGISSAGMSEESVQIVYAHVENEPRLGQHTEPTECIEVFTLAVPEIPRFLEENTTPIGTRAQLVLETFARNLIRYGE